MTPKTLTTLCATAIAAVAATTLVLLAQPILPFLSSRGVPAILATAYVASVAAWTTRTILRMLYDKFFYWSWKHASGALVVLVVLTGALLYVGSRAG